MIQAFRKKRYKATPQRIAICKHALQNSTHPTAKAIYQKVKEEFPTISLATVYKTLKILKELSLIQELPFSDGQKRFDPNIMPHINLVCIVCGNISDLDHPVVQSIIKRVNEARGFRVTGQRLDIYGVCEKCNRLS
ncbi:MAG: transcriptional repressor [Nitrososphaerales archaeon]|nr:transcriptional repressor [Nitrososphaerales archaeon]